MKPIILTDKSRVEGSRFVKVFRFNDGTEVPLYEVFTMSAFNQLIGHVKFQNAEYGNVYYRGVNGLYDNVRPSIMRKRNHGDANDLNKIIKSICCNAFFCKSLKLQQRQQPVSDKDYYFVNKINRQNKYRVEALLQHYSGNTRFLDVVDNHWVALWMGLHNFVMHGNGFRYCKCEKRELLIGHFYESAQEEKVPVEDLLTEENIYEYVLLLAMPYSTKHQGGIQETDEFIEVDLRKVLPSHYLRPHAQHALVIRRRDNLNSDKTASYYDMASQVVAILQVRIDRASLWLGNGNLLTSDNLFPSPSVDQGYNNLLMNEHLFINPFKIIRYY